MPLIGMLPEPTPVEGSEAEATFRLMRAMATVGLLVGPRQAG